MKPDLHGRARPGVPGWEHLRHGGLLLDATRLAALSRHVPGPLDDRVGRQLRHHAGAISDADADADSGAISSFVAFVLEEVCGLDASTGIWTRGNNVSPSWEQRAITGETVKPRHLWTGRNGARLPVFLDGGRRLGVGRGRRIVSQVLGWLRAGNDHLALVTNGRQWRLLFAGLDYDAWCEWDLDLWFEEGDLSPQVTALRTLLGLLPFSSKRCLRHQEFAREDIGLALCLNGKLSGVSPVFVGVKQQMAEFVRRGEDPAFYRDPIPGVDDHRRAPSRAPTLNPKKESRLVSRSCPALATRVCLTASVCNRVSWRDGNDAWVGNPPSAESGRAHAVRALEASRDVRLRHHAV